MEVCPGSPTDEATALTMQPIKRMPDENQKNERMTRKIKK